MSGKGKKVGAVKYSLIRKGWEGEPTLAVEPLREVYLDELLYAIPAGQAQPYGAAFAFGAQVDIKERAANPFPGVSSNVSKTPGERRRSR
jgi:hypothetical protein